MEDKERSIIREIIEFLGIFILAVVIALYIKSNIFFISRVEGPSMESNYFQGDRIVVSKLSYWFSKPEYGDVIVVDASKEKDGQIYNVLHEGKITWANLRYRFDSSIENRMPIFLKRVIALEGDVIDFVDGQVILNGEVLDEPYIQGYTESRDLYEYPLVIPKGKMYVMGDNRERSSDSRDMGMMDLYQLKGKVFYKFGGNK